MTDGEENPLKKLEISEDNVDLDALYSAIDGLIYIVKENGQPRPKERFFELSNKEKFVSLLLYRRAAVELAHLEGDEVGAESGWFTNYVDVDDSRIRQYAGDLSFVVNDSSRGGYHIPGFDISEAVSFLGQ